MSQNLSSQQVKTSWKKLLSVGILISEAAIATLVLSTFVSSGTKLSVTQTPASRPAIANHLSVPQPFLSVRLPLKTEVSSKRANH